MQSGLVAADALTIGFARRAMLYKRADLIFSNMNRLLEITQQVGSLQFIFAGKAHPKDNPGKDLIRHIFDVSRQLREQYVINAYLLMCSNFMNHPPPPLWIITAVELFVVAIVAMYISAADRVQ